LTHIVESVGLHIGFSQHHGFGEGGKGARPAAERVTKLVESICARIVEELQAEGLTNSPETFLEWQRPYVEAHISSDDPVLHSI